MTGLRPMKLPHDITAHLLVLRDGFQYPEKPEWNPQPDEIEHVLNYWNKIRNLWPIISGLAQVSPKFHNLLRGFMVHGFFFEEEGQIAGDITFLQRSGRQEWYISDVVVLPAFRRRGIARKLVLATLEDLRVRPDKRVILDVIEGNLPAYNLYKELGFEDYSGSAYFLFEPKARPVIPLPAGYSLSSLPNSDWRTEFEFDRRITPETIQKYIKPSENKYRRSTMMMALDALGKFLFRKNSQAFVVRSEASAQVVGIAAYNSLMRPGGINSIKVKIDPAHPAIAPFLITSMLEYIQKTGKGQRIELRAPFWQSALIEAAETCGGKKQLAIRRMGLVLD